MVTHGSQRVEDKLSFFLSSSLAEMYNAVGQTVKKEEVELVGESSLDDSLINLTGMNISVDFIL